MQCGATGKFIFPSVQKHAAGSNGHTLVDRWQNSERTENPVPVPGARRTFFLFKLLLHQRLEVEPMAGIPSIIMTPSARRKIFVGIGTGQAIIFR